MIVEIRPGKDPYAGIYDESYNRNRKMFSEPKNKLLLPVMHAHEMHAHDVPAYEMHANEVHA
jgi:hypothetical protein